jgi:tetratricopeptide (TPR) repeat protein
MVTRSRAAKSGAHGPPRSRRAWFEWSLCLLVVLITAAIYSQVRHHSFIGYDDPDFVSHNSHVSGGITRSAVAWAFSTGSGGNWMPLTWMSHMADWQLFGSDSGLHHLASVAFHLANTVLLFVVLRRMTRSPWSSALVAALFALHPLHVESVAWAAERKDVLCAFFWFLTMWAYLRWVDRPTAARYVLVFASLACSLLAKPMAVTLPFALLLLDVWPLERLRTKRLLLEKVPLVALSFVVSIVTFAVQRQAGAVAGIDAVPLTVRLANAVVSCGWYLLATFSPVNLAVFYPLPQAVPIGQAFAAAAALLAVSYVVFRNWRGKPYLAVGWLWYLVTLVPVLGLVQVGSQARADRYTYVPLVGIFIAAAWGAADVSRRWPRSKVAVAGLAGLACVACATLTSRQLGFCRNDVTLFSHAIDVTHGNFIAHGSLGLALRQQGRLDEAIQQYQKAIVIEPAYTEGLTNLGEAFLSQRRPDDAMPLFDRALTLKPDLVDPKVNRANALGQLGRPAEAIEQYRQILAASPDSAEAHAGLGVLFDAQGDTDNALAELHESVTMAPDYADGHRSLARLYARLGRTADALTELQTVCRLEPDDAIAHADLGSAFTGLDRLDDAIAEFSEALRLDPTLEDVRRSLVYARSLRVR